MEFTWLISADATKYAGIISFVITFECTSEETVDYVWSARSEYGIDVLPGKDHIAEIIKVHTDILAKIEIKIDELTKSIEDITQRVNDLEAIVVTG